MLQAIVLAVLVMNASAQNFPFSLETSSMSQGRGSVAVTPLEAAAWFIGGGFNSTADFIHYAGFHSHEWGLRPIPGTSFVGSYKAVTINNNFVILAAAASYTGEVHIFDRSTQYWSSNNLSLPRYDSAAASVNSFAVFGGGRVDPTNATSQVDIYNAATNTWTTSTLSTARYGLAATSVGNLILFAGGLVTGSFDSVDTVDIFDSTNGVWSTSQLPVARSYFAATSYGNFAYFASGTSDQMDIFDATARSWRSVTNQALFSLGSFPSATAITNFIIIAGGQGLALVYDATTDCWANTSLSLARESMAAVTVQDSVAFFGGGLNFSVFPAIKYDQVDIFVPTPGVRINCRSSSTSTATRVSGNMTTGDSASSGNMLAFALVLFVATLATAIFM